ncbi:MAG: hypothetical protein L0Y66_02250 [Myxococcaceae bacterium]|nr:hypothetical protein [Myxococcaceae bacterium]MCI0669955.1 hypothetical protein [Myxococcaceae bacterium]
MQGGRSPLHPILDEPSAYDVVELQLRLHDGEPYLDLTLQHRDTRARRQLRFLGPRDGKFWFEPAPLPCPYVYDVREKRLEGLAVLVADEEEMAAGPLSFWARDVVELAPGS